MRPRGRLTAEQAEAVRKCKRQLLDTLKQRVERVRPVERVAQRVNQRVNERDLLPQPAVAAKERHGWAADPEIRKRQWATADAIDEAWLTDDLEALRRAVGSS